MNKIDIDSLAQQVSANCDISDAHHAGLYSICGLALRLRDLFKWEKRIPPWVEKESAEILEWIDARETRWEKLIDRVHAGLEIGGVAYEVFDSGGINAVLEPFGFYYGAGYAFSLKPTFLLARIERKTRVCGHTVHILGQELARDLLTLPAMSQNGGIILRRDAARYYLWDKIAYIKKSGRPALNFGLRHCGLINPSGDELQRNFDKILAVQSRIYIHHEIGELEDTVFNRRVWREIIAAYPHTPVELSARTVKDLLADTGPKGSIQNIIDRKDAAALGFFVAFFDGLGRDFFPELPTAFQLFGASGDWQVIEQALAAGRKKARKLAETILSVYREGQTREDPKWAAKEIEKQILGGVTQR